MACISRQTNSRIQCNSVPINNQIRSCFRGFFCYTKSFCCCCWNSGKTNKQTSNIELTKTQQPNKWNNAQWCITFDFHHCLSSGLITLFREHHFSLFDVFNCSILFVLIRLSNHSFFSISISWTRHILPMNVYNGRETTQPLNIVCT